MSTASDATPGVSEDQEVAGTRAEVDAKLKPSKDTRYAIKNGAQAVSVCRNLKEAWRKGILNVRMMTAQLNGQKPRQRSKLRDQGKGWYPNISRGFLRSICAPIPARFFMPVLTAQYLTAAELPTGHPGGAFKSSFFRDEVSNSIKGWDGWPWFLYMLAREVGFFGFGYCVFLDEYQWRPTFVRQDAGFIPVGSKILQGLAPLFMCKYDYRVDEILDYVSKEQKAGRSFWKTKAVQNAVNKAATKPKDTSPDNSRVFEEMVRESTLGQTFEKSYRVVSTWHLFSTDPDGTVSHHIILADDTGKKPDPDKIKDEGSLLFERRGQFKSMDKVYAPLVFDPDTGSVHGSWGVAQMIFDISLENEKAVNDWIGAMKQLAKVKVQVGEGESAAGVKLTVDDIMMILEGGTYANNTAAVSADPKPFQALLEAFDQFAREKIGNYIPPIPLQPSDIKAAQINEKAKEQQERREQILLIWLIQIARVVRMIVERLTDADSNDEQAETLMKRLKENLQAEEIKMLAKPPPLQTIYDYTDYAASKRAAFAASKMGSPYYDNAKLERIQAEAALGRTIANDVLLPGEDATVERAARRQQEIEISAMNQGLTIEALPIDADWFHMQTLRPDLEQDLMQGTFDRAALKLNHYTAHYAAAVQKKTMPKDKINVEKKFVNNADKAIKTGILPPEGFADQVSLVESVETAMSSQPALAGAPESSLSALATA